MSVLWRLIRVNRRPSAAKILVRPARRVVAVKNGLRRLSANWLRHSERVGYFGTLEIGVFYFLVLIFETLRKPYDGTLGRDGT